MQPFSHPDRHPPIHLTIWSSIIYPTIQPLIIYITIYLVIPRVIHPFISPFSNHLTSHPTTTQLFKHLFIHFYKYSIHPANYLTDYDINYTSILLSTSSIVQSAQSCPTLCNPKDCSMPGFPVHHQLLELAQTHVHRVSDAIQPFHPLSSPSPPAFNLSQHQGLFQWVSSLHQVAKVLEFQLQHQSFQWTLRTDLL